MLVLAAVCAGIATLSLSGGDTRARHSPPSLSDLARRDARAFLSRYVTADGRVVRRDQHDDTVSEGQGYALLLAVAVGDRGEFVRVWRWEQRYLQLQSGLFAYHWARGKVVTAAPAADADLDTAWALTLAARRFHDPAYTADARAVARAILAYETVTAGGRLELVAGPWAKSDPAIVDPSYLAPEAMSALAAAGAGPSWRVLATDSTALVGALEAPGHSRLPSNWAKLAPDGTISPSGPGGKGSAAYGLDAQRVPVWFAASCSAASRRLAAASWPALRAAKDSGGRIAYTLSGRSRSRDLNPLGYVAAAAAADAAGHRAAGRALLARADRQNAVYGTYYGAAWLGLGRVLLDTTWLSPCPPA